MALDSAGNCYIGGISDAENPQTRFHQPQQQQWRKNADPNPQCPNMPPARS